MGLGLSQSQVDIANTILSVGLSLGATSKQLQAAFEAAWVESRFQNLNYGDRDSLGVFQQRPSQGWGSQSQILDVSYAATKFFQTAMSVSQSGTAGQLAQRVQRSGFPDRYDQQSATPLALLDLLMGSNSTAQNTNINYQNTASENNNNLYWLLLGFAAILFL